MIIKVIPQCRQGAPTFLVKDIVPRWDRRTTIESQRELSPNPQKTFSCATHENLQGVLSHLYVLEAAVRFTNYVRALSVLSFLEHQHSPACELSQHHLVKKRVLSDIHHSPFTIRHSTLEGEGRRHLLNSASLTRLNSGRMGSNSNAADASLAPLLVPISGATLFAQESTRRRNLRQKGAIPTGCPEIDDVLLLGGGFERGCVVGVSAEDVNFGVLVSFYSSSCVVLITALREDYLDISFVEEGGPPCFWLLSLDLRKLMNIKLLFRFVFRNFLNANGVMCIAGPSDDSSCAGLRGLL